MKGWLMSVVQKNRFGFIAKLEEILFSFTKGSFLKQSFLSNASKALVFAFAFALVGCGGAEAPNITTQPQSKPATAGKQSTLQVAAKVTDGGVLTYQWYSNTQNSNQGGTAISGANGDSYTFNVPSSGVSYYYVVVTNLNADAEATASTASEAAEVTVVNYNVYDVLYYDKDLNLIEVKTVKEGDAISVRSGTWYPLGSSTAVGSSYTVTADVTFFAVPNVVGITDRAGLEAINSNLAGIYVLQNNIDLSGANWSPIGTATSPFTGRLSGKSHKITGLKIDSSTDYVGLFGYIKGGNVLSLKLELGSDGIRGNDYVGSVAGYVNRGTITSVSVEGNVKGHGYVGGIAGYVDIGTITATYTVSNVTATGDYIGGVAGYIKTGTITATYTKGNVASPNGKNVGGVAGYSEVSTVTATYGKGDVSGNENIGGVVGYLRLGTVVASYLDGKVTGNSHADGVTGYNSFGLVIASLTNGATSSWSNIFSSLGGWFSK
jgi:hypothetical protein